MEKFLVHEKDKYLIINFPGTAPALALKLENHPWDNMVNLVRFRWWI